MEPLDLFFPWPSRVIRVVELQLRYYGDYHTLSAWLNMFYAANQLSQIFEVEVMRTGIYELRLNELPACGFREVDPGP